MNILLLIFHNIKKLITHNTITFLVVVLCLVISTFGILFYSGYIYKSSMERQSDRGVKIILTINEQTPKDEIKEIIETLSSKEAIQNVLVAADQPNQNEERYTLVGEYNVLYKDRLLFGNYFGRDENKPVVVMPENIIPQVVGLNINPIGKNINVGDVDFTIVGMVSYMLIDNLVIPVDYYLDKYPTRYIEITYEKLLSKDKYDFINTFVGSNSNIIYYEIDKPTNVLLTLSFWMEFGQVLLIFSIIIINVFMIMFFWIQRSKLTYNIYSIYGGSKLQVLNVIAGQSVLIILYSILLGSLLFYLFSDVFVKANLIVSNKPLFYLITIGIEFLITVIFTIISSYKANKNNEIYIIKE